MRTWCLEVPLKRPPMTLNGQRRAHWTKVRDAKTLVEWHVTAALKRTPIPPLDRASVTVTWRCGDRRTRDADGLAPFLKATLDALVHNGVIADDNYRHVPTVAMRIELDQENPRIEITVEETS